MILTIDEHKDLVDDRDADYCACCGGLYQIAGLVEAQMPDLSYAPIIDHYPLQGGYSVCSQCSEHCEQGPCEPKKLPILLPVTNEQLLALARKVQSDQTTDQWSDLDQNEQGYYQDWCKQLLATLISPEVRTFTAQQAYNLEQNMPPSFDLADWLVQNNYKMAVASMIEHFVWQEEEPAGKVQEDNNTNTDKAQPKIPDWLFSGPISMAIRMAIADAETRSITDGSGEITSMFLEGIVTGEQPLYIVSCHIECMSGFGYPYGFDSSKYAVHLVEREGRQVPSVREATEEEEKHMEVISADNNGGDSEDDIKPIEFDEVLVSGIEEGDDAGEENDELSRSDPTDLR